MSRTGWAGLVLLLGLVACGNDPAESPETDTDTDAGTEPGTSPSGASTPAPAYYGELAALTGALDEANTAADEALHAEMETTDPADIGDLFSLVTVESAERLENMLAEASLLSPPPDARSAHKELVAATQGELALSRDLAAGLAGLDQAGVEAYEGPADQAQVEGRVDQACLDLQALADAAGAEVDLCVGMFAEPRLG